MVYYRKYRPQTIDELDSTQVREKLSAVLSSKDIPHAFLFTGPKGLGKTSTARIVAKAINCQGKRGKGKDTVAQSNKEFLSEKLHPSPFTLHPLDIPCNQCDACVSITAGTNIDVLEIDGASNRGIDEIRDLREKVRLAPSSLKKKVYIIDEVHMLTTEAFNALLKTIEEPPNHVMFIFCTTEPQKVPATIISRCFHINFNLATEEEIVHSLERIVAGEKLHIDKDVLSEIAKLADGGFRDAAKILEELALLSQGKKMTRELVEDKFQISNIQFQMSNMLHSLEKRDTIEALAIVASLNESGTDIKYFITQLLEMLHELLLDKAGVQQNFKFQISNFKFSIEEITELISLFSKAYGDMKYTVIPQLPLEIAVIKSCTEQDLAAIEQAQVTATPSISPNPLNAQPTMHTLRKHAQNLKVQSILNPVKKEPKKIEPETTHEQKGIPDKHDNTASILENLIYKTKPYNHSVAAVLRGCNIKLFDNKTLILETAYKFHKERLDEKKTREILEKVLKEITGKDLEIKIQLASKS